MGGCHPAQYMRLPCFVGLKSHCTLRCFIAVKACAGIHLGTHFSPIYSRNSYMIIRRSKQSLLDIAIKKEGPEDSEAADTLAELISSHAYILQTLHIKAPMCFPRRHRSALHILSGPHMTHLGVDSTFKGGTPRTNTEAGNLLHDRLFTGNTAKLYTFEGRGIPLQFYPPLSSIQALYLALRSSITRTTLHATLFEPS